MQSVSVGRTAIPLHWCHLKCAGQEVISPGPAETQPKLKRVNVFSHGVTQLPAGMSEMEQRVVDVEDSITH